MVGGAAPGVSSTLQKGRGQCPGSCRRTRSCAPAGSAPEFVRRDAESAHAFVRPRRSKIEDGTSSGGSRFVETKRPAARRAVGAVAAPPCRPPALHRRASACRRCWRRKRGSRRRDRRVQRIREHLLAPGHVVPATAALMRGPGVYQLLFRQLVVLYSTMRARLAVVPRQRVAQIADPACVERSTSVVGATHCRCRYCPNGPAIRAVEAAMCGDGSTSPGSD